MLSIAPEKFHEGFEQRSSLMEGVEGSEQRNSVVCKIGNYTDS